MPLLHPRPRQASASAPRSPTTEKARKLIQVKYWNPRFFKTIVTSGRIAFSAQRFAGMYFFALPFLQDMICVSRGDVGYETIDTLNNPSHRLH